MATLAFLLCKSNRKVSYFSFLPNHHLRIIIIEGEDPTLALSYYFLQSNHQSRVLLLKFGIAAQSGDFKMVEFFFNECLESLKIERRGIRTSSPSYSIRFLVFFVFINDSEGNFVLF